MEYAFPLSVGILIYSQQSPLCPTISGLAEKDGHSNLLMTPLIYGPLRISQHLPKLENPLKTVSGPSYVCNPFQDTRALVKVVFWDRLEYILN